MSDATTEQTATKPRRLRSIAKVAMWTVFGTVIVVIVAATLFARYSVHRAFPQTEGTIQLVGLHRRQQISLCGSVR